jgi:hypothetical protein
VGGIPVPDAKGLETMLKGAKEKARSDDALLSEAMRDLRQLLFRVSKSKGEEQRAAERDSCAWRMLSWGA